MLKILGCLYLLFLFPESANAKQHTHTNKTLEKPALTTFIEGKDYRLLKTPVKAISEDKKIEVTEIFWYGCPHCYSLEMDIKDWKSRLPNYVDFVRVPAFFKPNLWKKHAQLYYTLKNMGIIEKVHSAIFDEIQNKKNRLTNVNVMAEFLSKSFSVNKVEFKQNYNSLQVVHQLLKTSTKVKSYGLRGVPVLIVNNQYVVEPSLAGSLKNMTVITDHLVNKVKMDRDRDKINTKAATVLKKKSVKPLKHQKKKDKSHTK